MQRCKICGAAMNHGTHYEKAKHYQYDDCPNCHTKVSYRPEEFYNQASKKEEYNSRDVKRRDRQ